MEHEIVGQRGAHAGEVVIVQRAPEFDHRCRHPPRRVAAGEALEELGAGRAAIVGVEVDVRDEATLGVDLGEIEGFDLGIRRVRCPREHADMLD